jgi:hypothetical protein
LFFLLLLFLFLPISFTLFSSSFCRCPFTRSNYKFIQPSRLTTPNPTVHCILGSTNFNYPADKCQPVVPNDPIPHPLT